MKRITLILFAMVIAFSSCENVENNAPALQGEIDSIFFKALEVRGQRNDDGTFSLQGINQDQTITVTVAENELGTYLMGEGRASKATYMDGEGNEYTTAPYGQGVIELTDRCISCGWLTGSFWFIAGRSENDTLPVSVQKGVFFEVSFLGGDLNEGGPPIGSVTASIDGVPFDANSVTADEDGVSIIIEGLEGTEGLRLQVPSNIVSGNYFLPRAGFSAAYINDGEVFEADDGGIVSVNFNDQNDRKILLFFNFEANGKVISSGRAGANY
ncbi:MAG: DUF6252 family protein [Bacteroidota bacterium]